MNPLSVKSQIPERFLDFFLLQTSYGLQVLSLVACCVCLCVCPCVRVSVCASTLCLSVQYLLTHSGHCQDHQLIHLPLDKMVAISQTIFSGAILWMKGLAFWFKILLKFVSKGPIDNDLALVQIMAWCQIVGKPLSYPMLTRFQGSQ